MTGIRELLDDAADTPQHDVDIDGLQRRARGRKRRAGAVAGTVVVLALVAGGVVFAATDDATIVRTPVVAPADVGNTPEGWHRVESREAGISIAIPPEWGQLPNDIAFVVGGPASVIVVGTAARTQPGVIAACSPEANVPPTAGAWLSIYEYDRTGPWTLPTGEGALLPEVFGDRPVDFGHDTDLGPRCGGATVSSRPNGADLLPFRDQGRTFLARIVVIGDAEGKGLALGREILNTLRVEPMTTEEPASTVPSATTPTTLPPVDGTTPAPVTTVPSPEVEAASAAAHGWLNTRPSDAVADFVEDFDAIADSLRAGLAQHSPDGLAAMTGRVESVTRVLPNQVVFRYTILRDGAPMIPNLTGTVIRVEGTWKVSRETVCELLARGGITCPPRAG